MFSSNSLKSTERRPPKGTLLPSHFCLRLVYRFFWHFAMFCVILLAGACGKSVCAGRRAALLNSGKGDILCHPMPPVIFLLLRCSALRAMRSPISSTRLLRPTGGARREFRRCVCIMRRCRHRCTMLPLSCVPSRPPGCSRRCAGRPAPHTYRCARVCIRLLHELCAQPRDEPLYRRAGRPACDVYASLSAAARRQLAASDIDGIMIEDYIDTASADYAAYRLLDADAPECTAAARVLAQAVHATLGTHVSPCRRLPRHARYAAYSAACTWRRARAQQIAEARASARKERHGLLVYPAGGAACGGLCESRTSSVAEYKRRAHRNRSAICSMPLFPCRFAPESGSRSIFPGQAA